MGRWEEDIALMRRGTSLLFSNDFKAAEALFKRGMLPRDALPPTANGHVKAPPIPLPPNPNPNPNPKTVGNGSVNVNVNASVSLKSIAEEEGEAKSGCKDLRGAFALQLALVSVIKGAASLANDQLDECLQRLWEADELAKEGEDWIGRAVVRGVTTLMGGVIQCLQHSFVKGVYNILKSWVWIKRLPAEGLDFQGKEACVVRSSTLFTLGIFNVLLSLLPPQMLKAATLLSGFQGSRREGLKMLEQCWEENGILSPWAALCIVVYKVDTKAFTGEKQTRADYAHCARILQWARSHYPNSVFFSVLEADLFACKKNLHVSRQITNAIAPHVPKELRAIDALLNYKRGMYALADLDFQAAARFFENALNVYRDVGRRGLVPCMAMYAALGYLIVAEHRREVELERNSGFVIDPDEELEMEMEMDMQAQEALPDLEYEREEITMNSVKAAAHAEEMLTVIAKYKAMPKDNWGRQDLWAFSVHERYDTNIENQWPLLDMVDCMIMRMRCSRWLSDQEADQLLRLVKCEENERENIGPDERIRVCAYFAEILCKRGKHDDSLAWCEAGLKQQSKLSPQGKNFGAAPLLIYLRALNMSSTERLLESKATLAEIDQFGNGYVLYQVLSFKTNVLTKYIDCQLEDKYQMVTVPPGKGVSADIDVSQEDLDMSNKEEDGVHYEVCIVWEWLCEAMDISFTAFFRPASGADISIIQNVDRHEAKDGPVAGRYIPDVPGSLQLEWDNRYSFLRPKVINYRLSCTLIEKEQ